MRLFSILGLVLGPMLVWLSQLPSPALGANVFEAKKQNRIRQAADRSVTLTFHFEQGGSTTRSPQLENLIGSAKRGHVALGLSHSFFNAIPAPPASDCAGQIAGTTSVSELTLAPMIRNIEHPTLSEFSSLVYSELSDRSWPPSPNTELRTRRETNRALNFWKFNLIKGDLLAGNFGPELNPSALQRNALDLLPESMTHSLTSAQSQTLISTLVVDWPSELMSEKVADLFIEAANLPMPLNTVIVLEKKWQSVMHIFRNRSANLIDVYEVSPASPQSLPDSYLVHTLQ